MKQRLMIETNFIRKNAFLSSAFSDTSRDRNCHWDKESVRTQKFFSECLPLLQPKKLLSWNGWGPRFKLLGHMTALLLPLFKTFPTFPVFTSVNFWINFTSIVFDTELADRKLTKVWEMFLVGRNEAAHFVLQKSTKPPKTSFLMYRLCTELLLKSGTLDHSELVNFPFHNVKTDFFAEGIKNANFWAF